jgi:ATP-binding cassette subfamily F protein 3
VWQGLDFSLYRGQRVALVGPNGCGKSTLLKVLAGELQASSGYVETGSNVDRGYYSQHQLEVLQPERSTLAEIRRLADPRTTEQELMSVLGLFMLGQGYFDRPVQELSGGEKSRLLLASLFLARANFLLMDEPTNHLDLESRQGLLEALDAFPGTLLVVAHDRWLLAEAVDEVWELTPAGLEIFLGGYEEYERVRRARREAPEPPQAGAELSSGEPRPGLSREEQKRRKRDLAEQRNALYRELQPRQEAYASLERDLEQALQRVDETERLLADPKVYADGSRTAELLKEYHAWKETSESLLEKMAGLEDEITRLEERQKQVGAPG